MPQPMGGIGQPLPIPQYLYPSELAGSPYDTGTNQIGLPAGEAIYVPAGHWLIGAGAVSAVQFKDPIQGAWVGVGGTGTPGPLEYLWSDGGNIRIANLTGTTIGASVTSPGAGYSQSTVSVTSSDGTSTWQAVVGGACSVVSITNPGAGYTRPPLVFIPAPPAPGVPATAIATLTGSSVTGISLTNPGAGYLSPPNASILPSQFETGVITTPATATLGLTGAGTITAVICTNPSAASGATPTITVAGGTTAASVTAIKNATAATSDTIQLQPAP